MTAAQVNEKILALVTPMVADLQLDLYDLEFNGGILKITVDTPPGSDGGVTLDKLALITRLLNHEFEHNDPISGNYTLEVSSPGLERTLRTPAHFQREIGKIVAIRLREVFQGARRLQGVLIASDATTATFVSTTQRSPNGWCHWTSSTVPARCLFGPLHPSRAKPR